MACFTWASTKLLWFVKALFCWFEWGVGRTGMGHFDWSEGRLLLGHSLVGCSSGEAADRCKDKPTWLGWVSAGCWASLTARSDLLLGGLEVVVDLDGRCSA